jgi:hypothetical protein
MRGTIVFVLSVVLVAGAVGSSQARPAAEGPQTTSGHGSSDAAAALSQGVYLGIPMNDARAAVDRWLADDEGTLVDRSGRTFKKSRAWQAYGTQQDWGEGKDFAAYRLDVEGRYVSTDTAQAEARYTGPAGLIFHRRPDGSAAIDSVLLPGNPPDDDSPALKEFVNISVVPAAQRESVLSAAALYELNPDNAARTLETWLTRDLPLGLDVMKEPGGTVQVGPSKGPGMIVVGQPSPERKTFGLQFSGVPYHRMSANREEYTGRSEAEFIVNGDGLWVLYRVWLLGMRLRPGAPMSATWQVTPETGIPVAAR